MIHSLQVMTPMIKSAKFDVEAMHQAALGGYINATDCADYLAKKGCPFRDAYKIVGELVAYCIEKKCSLNDLVLDEMQSFSSLFDEDVYDAIDLQTCVSQRNVLGGPAPEQVKIQIQELERFIETR